MSKQNNLTDFLTDVANAIRAKKGSTDLINPQNFSAEIASLSGGLEIVDMTETTATIEPNKVYVWGMVASLNITLGASTDDSDFFAFRFRCSKPTMTSLTVNGATWADDTELDEVGKPVLDLGSWYQCEIKGGTSALYARLAHYIPFEDSNVEAVLLAKGVGDGLGVTYKDAAKVTSISTWFKGNADITAFSEFVNFSGISGLVLYAFQNCTSLAEITFPGSLTSIGGTAFKNCTSLAEITLPASLTSIEDSAFQNCSTLAEITFPGSLTSIGGTAFENCTSLAEITLPASLTSIGNYAFNGCSSLTRVVNLENTKVTSISVAAFRNCTSLAEVTLPAGVISIGNGAFQGTSFEEITFPASLTSIGSSFYSCKKLKRVINIENTQLTIINHQAFYGCSTLAEITFPGSLTSIGNYAFFSCTSLQYIRIEATTPPTLSATNAIPSTIGAIYVPDESVAAYQAATNWSSFASKIKGISEMPA